MMHRILILSLFAAALFASTASAQIVDGGFTGLYDGGSAPDSGTPAGAWEIEREDTSFNAYIDYWPGTTGNECLWLYQKSVVVQQHLATPLTGTYSIEFDLATDVSSVAGPEYYGMAGDFSHRVEAFGLRTDSEGRPLFVTWDDVGSVTNQTSHCEWVPGEEMHLKIVTNLDTQRYDVYARSNGVYPYWVQVLDDVFFRHSAQTFTQVDTVSFASFTESAYGAIDNVSIATPFADVAPGVVHTDSFDSAPIGNASGTNHLRQFEGEDSDFQIVADPLGSGNCVSLTATETIPEEGDPTYRGSASIDFGTVVPETTANEGAKMSFDLYLDPTAPPALLQASVGGKTGSWSTVKATFGVDGNRIWMVDGADSGGGGWYYSANTLDTGKWYTFEADMALGGDGANHWNLKVTDRDGGTVVLDSMSEGIGLTFRDYTTDILQTQFFNGYGDGTALIDNYRFEVSAVAPAGVGPVSGIPSYGIDFDSGYTPGNLTADSMIRVGQDGWRLREGDPANIQIAADSGGSGNVLQMTGNAENDRQAVNRTMPKVEVTDTTKFSFDLMWQGDASPTQFVQISLGDAALANSYDYMSMEFGINGDRFFIGDGRDTAAAADRYLSDYTLVSEMWYTVEALIHMQGEDDNTYSFVIKERDSGTVVWDTEAAGLTATFRDYDLEMNTTMVVFYKTSDPNVLTLDNFLLEAISGIEPLDGDLDGDGFVGSSDLDIVRANWGQNVDAGCLSCGDPSGDGLVGSADLDIVRANWGAGTPPASVPEPGVFALLLGAALFAVTRRS